ncbi:MAG: antitoxin VapB family protein [Kiritimatiellae bacterium]|nr:antitoxin VapB family protein [Kiritimatiellia bacterium]
MSTKTVAIKSEVYQKLAQEKREEESFTKTIDRLLSYQQTKTCASAVREAAKLWGSVESAHDEAQQMEQWIATERSRTDWSAEQPQ